MVKKQWPPGKAQKCRHTCDISVEHDRYIDNVGIVESHSAYCIAKEELTVVIELYYRSIVQQKVPNTCLIQVLGNDLLLKLNLIFNCKSHTVRRL